MSELRTDQVIAAVRDLPAMSGVVGQILTSLSDDSMTMESLADKISTDQALTAKTLKLANSPFYGVPRQVNSVQEAISILGLRTIRSMVIASGVAGTFKPEQCKQLDFQAFWRHSVATAVCAQTIARATDHPQDAAFVVGLVHDIGRLALAVLFPQAYAEVVQYRQAHDCSQHEAEWAALGVDHAQIGGSLAEHWCFPPEMVQAVKGHHVPSVEGGKVNLATLVHVADHIVHALDVAGDPHEIVEPLDLMVWYELGLGEAQCWEIFKQTETRLDGICSGLFA